jgi:hypothetical protein
MTDDRGLVGTFATLARAVSAVIDVESAGMAAPPRCRSVCLCLWLWLGYAMLCSLCCRAARCRALTVGLFCGLVPSNGCVDVAFGSAVVWLRAVVGLVRTHVLWRSLMAVRPHGVRHPLLTRLTLICGNCCDALVTGTLGYVRSRASIDDQVCCITMYMCVLFLFPVDLRVCAVCAVSACCVFFDLAPAGLGLGAGGYRTGVFSIPCVCCAERFLTVAICL